MAAITNEYMEYIEAREDEIARFITAQEYMDHLRTLLQLLHQRQRVTTPYYQDICDTLTYIDGALLLGKQNTAALRNGRRSHNGSS